MRKSITMIIVLAVTVLVAVAGEGYGAGQVANGEVYSVEQMLTYALEDEYKTRALYQELQELSGAVRPFYRKESGINFHIDTLTSLCDAYGVTVPGDRAGEYTVLPETVQESVEAVYKAARESLLMYETFLTGTLPADVRSAFVYLRNAASRHVAMLAYSQEADSIWYGSGRRTAPQYRQPAPSSAFGWGTCRNYRDGTFGRESRRTGRGWNSVSGCGCGGYCL